MLPAARRSQALAQSIGWPRRLRRFGLLLVAVAGMAALGLVARGGRELAGAGDIAVMESYTIDAVRLHLLVGPYSRFMWHHPGPMLFYVLAPFYVLSGFKAAGLAAGAVAINLASLVTIGLVSVVEADSILAGLITASAVAYALRFHGLLASAWNPHVVVLPVMALIVVSSAVASGRVKLLPVAVVLGSLITQSHVGVVPVVGAVVGVAFVAMVVKSRITGDETPSPALRPATIASAAVLTVLWLPTLREQLTGTPGNLSTLWRFFSAGSPRRSSAAAAYSWADAVTGPMRPSFGVPLGVPFVSQPSRPDFVLAVALLVAVGAVAVVAARRHRIFPFALAGLTLAALIGSWWSVTHISGGIIDHQVFWISAVGPLAVAVILDSLITSRPGPGGGVLRRLAAPVVVTVLLACAGISGVAALRGVVRRSYSPSDREAAAQLIADRIQDIVRTDPAARLMIGIDPPAWEVAAGVITALQKARVPIAVERENVWLFTDVFAPSGAETAIVFVSTGPVHRELVERRGARTIAAGRGIYADALCLRCR